MESQDNMQKISGIGLGVSLQLSFLVLKKSKILTSHQGIIIRLSMEETMISQNKVRITYLVILKF